LFWQITPLRFTNIMRGRQWAREEEEKARIAGAWYGEAFRRQKRLPDLETLLTPQDELAEQTADDIFAVLLQMQAAGAHMTIEEVDESWLLQ
jgi:hypothetical protein